MMGGCWVATRKTVDCRQWQHLQLHGSNGLDMRVRRHTLRFMHNLIRCVLGGLGWGGLGVFVVPLA